MGQVTHVLLTRLPLMYSRRSLIVRLTCIKRAASVHPEPRSNSPWFSVFRLFVFLTWIFSRPCSASYHYSTVKVLDDDFDSSAIVCSSFGSCSATTTFSRFIFPIKKSMLILHRLCNLTPLLASVLRAITILCTHKYSILHFLVKYAVRLILICRDSDFCLLISRYSRVV